VQLTLPLFPRGSKSISASLVYFVDDSCVHYFYSGLPIGFHSQDDNDSFKFWISFFIYNGFCKRIDIKRAFLVSDYVIRNCMDTYNIYGAKGFFGQDAQKRKAYKLTESLLKKIQKSIDAGGSINSIAKQNNLSEGSIRYQIKKAKLTKKAASDQPKECIGSQSSDRSMEDISYSNGLGVATSNEEDRLKAAIGVIDQVETAFGDHNGLKNGGILLSISALLSQGLMRFGEVYKDLTRKYYNLNHIVILLAYMALLRIKNPEQLKTCKPGELGRCLGLDRSPETKCLRERVDYMAKQKLVRSVQSQLASDWIVDMDDLVFYADGHMRIYYGNKATLPKKYIARQKLCLSATAENWVNDIHGQPLMVYMGELTDKLKDSLVNSIIPELIKQTSGKEKPEFYTNPQVPRFTLVFDREVYEPKFFASLWNSYRIAIITYRKFVKENWPLADFQKIDYQELKKNENINLCEKEINLNGHGFREIRKLCSDNHQTSIITTNRVADSVTIARYMFSRWNQENYFKYMIAEFDFDKLLQYGVEQVNPTKVVPNPEFNKTTYLIKKEKEKKNRLSAKILDLEERMNNSTIDQVESAMAKKPKLLKQKGEIQSKIDSLVAKRNETPARIEVEKMPELKRYNELKNESKHIMNLIKMIAYRAETSLVNLVINDFQEIQGEERTIIKTILASDADIKVDKEAKQIIVTVHSQSTNKANLILKRLCELLNETEQEYPGTNLVLKYNSH